MIKNAFLLLVLCICVHKPIYSQTVLHTEFLGAGLLISLNADTRLGESTNLGIRYGLSTLKADDGRVLALPLQINYLLGKKHGIEFAAGVTPAFAPNGLVMIATCGLMYRFQAEGGFNFRIGLQPLYNLKEKELILFWPGLSIGYRFN